MQLQQHADSFGRRNLHRNLHSHREPTAPPAKLSIHRSETRMNGKTSNQPIENRTNSKKPQENDRKLERTVANFRLSIKTQTNGRELEFTEQNLERTAENSNSPNKTSNEWWKTRTHRTKPRTNGGKWLHQHTTTRKLQNPQELDAVDGNRFYTAPRWVPDDPAC